MRRLRPAIISAAFAALGFTAFPTASRAQAPQQTRPAPSSPATEQGDFILHFLQHAIGAEHYELKRSANGAGLTLEANFEYTDRGVKVPLSATLEMSPDFTPVHFRIKGKSYRYFSADADIHVSSSQATVVEGERSRQLALPSEFFTVDGYSPISVQMMMMRYWLRHGRPEHLFTLPAGDEADDVTIVLAGHDTVNAGDRRMVLDRYTVNNVVWGRESVWMSGQRLAAITTYTGGLAFEAVEKDLDSALPQLIRSEVADRMHDLAELSNSIAPAEQGSYAIVGATLIDGTGRAPIPDSVVVVRDGKIVAAGPSDQVHIPGQVRKVDAHGLTLLPGLWEMHAHYAQIEWGPIYLASGVTTARDCGNEFEFITAVRDAIASGKGLGPRLLPAGLIDGAGPEAFGVNWATTPEEGRALVDKYKNAGFVQIKIYNLITPDVLRAITAEAHRLGMTVTGHIPNGMNAFEGVNDGMDQINHLGYAMTVMRAPGAGSRFDANSPEARKAIGFFQEHHTVIDPTISWNELLGHPTDEEITSFEPGFRKLPYQLSSLIGQSGVAPSEGARSRERLAESLRAVKAIYDTGIPIVPGTDKGVPGFSLHRELELYVQAGLTPMQAIQTATIVPARVMGLDKESGSVEAGKRADLILVDGDPLTDFSALRKVRWVITNGRMYETAPLWQSVGFRP